MSAVADVTVLSVRIPIELYGSYIVSVVVWIDWGFGWVGARLCIAQYASTHTACLNLILFQQRC